MSIISGATMMGRKQAEARMTAACTISRSTGSTVDPETGLETATSDVVYTGPCELQFNAGQADSATPDGQQVAVQQPILKLPVSTSGGVAVGDVFVITGSLLDSSMVGVSGRVAGRHLREYSTSRRLPVEVVS